MLRAWLFLTVALPALAISRGMHGDEVVFVLYREPKLTAAMVGAWLLLAILAWARPAIFSRQELAKTLRRPEIRLGLAFVTWMALTGLWGVVPELYVYEIQQYLTLALLWVALVTWARLESDVGAIVRAGLCSSAAVVTGIAGLQVAGLLPDLAPIDPHFGASHPSLMGYKNPAALAILGQLFLLAGLVIRARSRRARILLGALVTAEIVYLATLHSRTTYVALGVGVGFAVALALSRTEARRWLPRILGTAAVAGTVFAIALLADADNLARFRSLAGVMSPDGYLHSDRGTYLRNTLNIVEHHPAGVGLGHWQTCYPVFRLHDRYRSFDATFQVRRAHSDHVQVLGEGGWFGLGLWLAWIGLVLFRAGRRYYRHGDVDALFTTAQLVTVTMAMATDYVIEMPYHKLQFFLLAFLACAVSESRDANSSIPDSRSFRPSRPLAIGLSLAALAMAFYQVEALRKQQLSAELLRSYTAIVEELGQEGKVPLAALDRVRILGSRFDERRGTSKTYHRDHLARAHLALLRGDSEEARRQVACALELHPYSSKAFGLMARAAPPDEIRKWQRAQTHVLDEATAGFELEIPRISMTCPR